MDVNLQSIKQRFGIIGRSEMLDRAIETAARVANTDLSVLITGESGVGKEVISKIIYSLSARKHNKFIAINCGAIPEGTINSELFGHEKGSFTGATGERKGYFESYNGGTIFLDEIGEMPLDTQAFLLRVLETGEFIRVGSNKVQRTDIRIIAATNVNLQEKIKSGKFREDLYFRISTVPIKVPALRERVEDIYPLFRKFVVDFAEKYRTSPIQLNERAVMMMENYSWPGNIRELKHTAEQLSVLAQERIVTEDALLQLIPNITKRNLPALTQQNGSSDNFQEREILYKLLFEMKSDLNELKTLVFELIRNNDLRVPNASSLKALRPADTALPTERLDSFSSEMVESYLPEIRSEISKFPAVNDSRDQYRPIIIDNKTQEQYSNTEVFEENLSLEENEKDLIKKALRKHNGRRKEAAQDLGISERTLYRKIKQYEL